MNPRPNYGEQSDRGSGKLQGKSVVITGGDGIGCVVALAFVCEGVDVLIVYLTEDEDAQETLQAVEKEGRKWIAIRGDIREESHYQQIIQRVWSEFGKLDILVRQCIEEIPPEEFDRTFKTNVDAMFYLCTAVPHMPPRSAIINTCSLNAAEPMPTLLAYATTKAAIINNFTGRLAQSRVEKSIRVNSVALGSVWTPLIPATMPSEQVKQFEEQTPMQCPAQPAELAPTYVVLASEDPSYISGAGIPVTGGQPVLP